MTQILWWSLLCTCSTSALVSLHTRTTVKATKKQAFDYLATPVHWPQIVLSSWSVEDAPSVLRRSSTVSEVFGLPPVLPLRVDWTCIQSDGSTLDVRSSSGVSGIASDCRMLFAVAQDGEETTVDLTMEYEPSNVLGYLGIPILTIDNALALKSIFPYRLRQELGQKSPLDDFRSLMGNLYGVAGVAHLVDCLTESKLLVAAGSAPFVELAWVGKALTLLWCAAGPLAWAASQVGIGDVGIAVYGLLEMVCAGLVKLSSSTSGEIDPLMNAVAVQAIVGASWLYSSRKPSEE